MQLDNQALHGGAPRAGLRSVAGLQFKRQAVHLGRRRTWLDGVLEAHGWRAVDEVSSASSRTGAQGAAASVPHEATSGGDTDVIHRSGGQTTWGVICKIWD